MFAELRWLLLATIRSRSFGRPNPDLGPFAENSLAKTRCRVRTRVIANVWISQIRASLTDVIISLFGVFLPSLSLSRKLALPCFAERFCVAMMVKPLVKVNPDSNVRVVVVHRLLRRRRPTEAPELVTDPRVQKRC